MPNADRYRLRVSKALVNQDGSISMEYQIRDRSSGVGVLLADEGKTWPDVQTFADDVVSINEISESARDTIVSQVAFASGEFDPVAFVGMAGGTYRLNCSVTKIA